MNAADIAAVIASYLVERDDVAHAELVGEDRVAVAIKVETQGGALFTVQVAPAVGP